MVDNPLMHSSSHGDRSRLLATVLSRHAHQPHRLLQVLRELQSGLGWLPPQLLVDVAQALQLSRAQVQGVAGFYRFLHTRPVGRYRILFSDNITDRLLGSEALLADLCTRLGVAKGVLREDGLVSVATASCTGFSDQGPALLVNHQHVVTRLNSECVACMAGLIQAQVPVARWPASWFRIDDQIRRADVLLGSTLTPGQALGAALARVKPREIFAPYPARYFHKLFFSCHAKKLLVRKHWGSIDGLIADHRINLRLVPRVCLVGACGP